MIDHEQLKKEPDKFQNPNIRVLLSLKAKTTLGKIVLGGNLINCKNYFLTPS